VRFGLLFCVSTDGTRTRVVRALSEHCRVDVRVGRCAIALGRVLNAVRDDRGRPVLCDCAISHRTQTDAQLASASQSMSALSQFLYDSEWREWRVLVC
jgi:hypothetical protein